MREKSHHPHGTAAIQKVTSGSGKSHQGRRITMAQPLSSIIRDLVKSSKQASSKQQQAAASSSKQQQAAGKQQQASSSKQAASKQQPAFAPLKEWTNISFKNQRDTKNWTFSRRTALKQWNRSITKSCDDAKLELFPGARPPDTTFRNWCDLNRALVWSSKNPTEIHGFDPQKPLKRFNKSLQIS